VATGKTFPLRQISEVSFLSMECSRGGAWIFKGQDGGHLRGIATGFISFGDETINDDVF